MYENTDADVMLRGARCGGPELCCSLLTELEISVQSRYVWDDSCKSQSWKVNEASTLYRQRSARSERILVPARGSDITDSLTVNLASSYTKVRFGKIEALHTLTDQSLRSRLSPKLVVGYF